MTQMILAGIAIMSLGLGVMLLPRQRKASYVLVQQPRSGRRCGL